jgi:hypothetical protein
MPPLVTKPFAGLVTDRPETYPGADGFETHYYFQVNPVAAPATGLIMMFPQAAAGYVNVIDKFNASCDASDASNNVVLLERWSIDLQTRYWKFNLQMSLLVGNPQYSYPTLLSSDQRVAALSFQCMAGGSPVEWFSFRHRYIRKVQ